MAASLFQRRIGAATDTHIAVARFEGADETGKLPPHISAVLNSAPHHIGSHARGAGCFAAEGLNKKAINYQLLALRCGHRSLVGNRLACSACRSMVGTKIHGRRERIYPFRLYRLCQYSNI